MRLQDTWSQILRRHTHISEHPKKRFHQTNDLSVILLFSPWEKKLPKKLPGPLGVYINRSGRYNTSAFGRSRPNSYFLVVGHGRLFDSPRERGGTPCCIIQVQPQILTIYCHFLCKCHCSHCCIHQDQFSLVHV
jgi:hypothetical protein